MQEHLQYVVLCMYVLVCVCVCVCVRASVCACVLLLSVSVSLSVTVSAPVNMHWRLGRRAQTGKCSARGVARARRTRREFVLDHSCSLA